MSAQQIECPICFDAIELNRNCVTTECGHMFHCSCLMTNTAHNGFKCPYCRVAMAEEQKEEDEDDDDEYELEDETDIFSDDALTSFRMFHRNLNQDQEQEDQQQDQDQEQEEQEEDQEEQENQDEEEDEKYIPSAQHIANKLTERGFTMEDLVKNLLLADHPESSLEMHEERAQKVYGQIRAILCQYKRSVERSEANEREFLNSNPRLVNSD